MLRILVIIIVCATMLSGLVGCKEETTAVQQDNAVENVKTQAEYDAQAKQEITKENASSELDKVELRSEC